MNQREVRGEDNIAWTCAQAFAAAGGPAAEEAAARSESAAGTVPVVCTPSGGEATVRLELASDWFDGLPDEELLAAIERARE